MINVTEQIHELRNRAQEMPQEVPEERAYLLGLADDLEHAQRCYVEILARVLAIAEPRYEAREARRSELHRLLERDEITRAGEHELGTLERKRINAPRQALELSRHADLQQRLTTWCAELKLASLLTPAEERAIGIVIPPSPRHQAEVKQEQAKIDRLVRTRETILATISDKGKRADALAQYNMVGGFLDEGKIHAWIQRCVSKRLLGPEYLAGARLGGFVQKLLQGGEHNGTFIK